MRCPICRGSSTDPRWQPFCSKRCQSLDLARWLDGDYRIVAEPVDPEMIGALVVDDDSSQESPCD